MKKKMINEKNVPGKGCSLTSMPSPVAEEGGPPREKKYEAEEIADKSRRKRA